MRVLVWASYRIGFSLNLLYGNFFTLGWLVMVLNDLLLKLFLLNDLALVHEQLLHQLEFSLFANTVIMNLFHFPEVEHFFLTVGS
jgi:hypothetical protein